ncbi:flavodoxin family protein [uncultured Cohaesibacter sp.]|uniref:flavodoxin family protein n=1 Tax=uncultured Cohaesibacter sp. TaxID=1002546 RepID=UPI0029C7CBFC|nr:flavodoxin family protein [uncultured Cohaesibacter sp.]
MTDVRAASVVVLYHSGYGHTEAIAKSVAKGAESVGNVTVTQIKADNENLDWESLAAADAIVFGSPTYMGSVSAQFKGFMDASSKVWAAMGWKDKLAGGFTVSASQSGDKLNTLIQLSVFAAQHGMQWVSTGTLPGNNNSQGSVEDVNRLGSTLGLMAQANADQGADVAPPATDHRTAELFGARIAEAAKRWNSIG